MKLFFLQQVLKERGENISKLEQANANTHKELMEATSKISNLETKLSEKKKKIEAIEEETNKVKAELETKDKTLRDMEEEIWKLKNNDSQTESLSTSTLSKVEESARLADVEETFEERYSKVLS